MKKWNILLGLVWLMILVSGCQTKDDRITIGVILPLTGEISSFGNLMKENILMAYKEQDTTKYELMFIDSRSESKTAISGLQKLISTNNVKYVIGDVGSSVTLSLIPFIERNEIFLLSPGASSPKLNNISPYFARNFPTDMGESKAVAKFVRDKLIAKKIAVIYSNTEYGLGLYSGFISGLNAHKTDNLACCESYEPDQVDFKSMLAKLKQINPDVLYLAGEEKGMGRFMNQYKSLNLNCRIISNINFLQPNCMNVAGESAEGVIVPLADYDPENSGNKKVDQFAKLFKSHHNRIPSIADAVSYDVLNIMIDAIENGKTPLEAAKYIRNYKQYSCALGIIDFENGDVSMPIAFNVIKNGEVVEY